ncbi:MAG: hypothetical protein WD336_11515 [Trueperaceae bacterium]
MALLPFLLVALVAAAVTAYGLTRWRRANPDTPWPTVTITVLAVLFAGYLIWLAWMTFGVGPDLRGVEPGPPPLLSALLSLRP